MPVMDAAHEVAVVGEFVRRADAGFFDEVEVRSAERDANTGFGDAGAGVDEERPAVAADNVMANGNVERSDDGVLAVLAGAVDAGFGVDGEVVEEVVADAE